MNHLYIFTLNWNKSKELEKLKETLLPNLTDIPFTWMIKDNASTDNSADVVKSWEDSKKQINLFKYADNKQNFSEGMNYLFHQATPKDNDYVMLLNNDVIFNDTTSIKSMLSLINKDKNIGIVGAKLLFTNTDTIQHYGVVFESPHRLPMHYRIREQDSKESSKNRLFQAVTGAVLLMKAGDYKNVYKNDNGVVGMDEQFRWSFDDVDLCLAVSKNMNKKIVCCGNTNIFHEQSASLKRNPVNKLFMNHNVNRLLEKWNNRYIVDKHLYVQDDKYNLYGNG